LRWEYDCIRAVAFGLKPGLTRSKFIETLCNDGQVGTRNRVVELDENVTGLHAVAVLDVEFANDPTRGVLDLLYVRIHDDRTLRDECPSNLSGRSPSAHAECEQKYDQGAGEKMAVYGIPRASRRGRRHHPSEPLFEALDQRGNAFCNRHAPALPLSGTTLRGRGMASGRCSTLERTSSFGPMAWTLPIFIISNRSTPAMALGRWATTTTIPLRSRTLRMARVSASSPSESRFELGSSSTTRNGSR